MMNESNILQESGKEEGGAYIIKIMKKKSFLVFPVFVHVVR